MASFGCQIGLCRWFTYWTIFLPTLGSPTDMYGGTWRINIYSISRSSSAAFSVSTIVTKTVLTSSSAASPSSAPDWVSLGCYTDMSDPWVLDEECWWGWFYYISVKWWSTNFVEWFIASGVLGIWHINVVLAVQGIYINPSVPPMGILMGRLSLCSMSRLLLQLSMF